MGSSVTMNDDEHNVLESSIAGGAGRRALIIIVSGVCSIAVGTGEVVAGRRRSSTASISVSVSVSTATGGAMAGKLLYFDTCCLCHSCNSRVINFLEKKIKIDHSKYIFNSSYRVCSADEHG